jgi:outer membrane receptor protein involved in Fe transport
VWSLAVALVAPAHAQTGNASPAPSARPVANDGSKSAEAATGEIVVTALKRSETSLQTAATVTIISSDALAQKNVSSVSQLSAVVPGLTVATAVAGLPGVSFRGVGSNSAVFNLEPSVAVYQDGVYYGHSRDLITPLYDVEQLEMIKGTQSTLLGKNTSLGAISIVTRRPGKDIGYDIRATMRLMRNG